MIPIAIIGGGPAGATTGIALRQTGIACTIFEKNQQFVYKPGEGLSPLVKPLLSKLDILKELESSNHLMALGHQVLWGSDEPHEFPFLFQPYGHGWHIDRIAFEKQLIDIAINRGVVWKPAHRLLSCQWEKDHWTLQFIRGEKKENVKARFLVDATGRSCIPSRMLGAKRQREDRLIGCSLTLSVNQIKERKHYTLVEAVEQGWWYAALLSNQKISLSFMTDADLLPFETTDVEGFFDLLKSTKMIWDYIGGAYNATITALKIKPAGTSKLNNCVGTHWLATGDAAMAFDPLSGYGITAAMGGAFYAAEAMIQYFKGVEHWDSHYANIMQHTYQKCLPLFSAHYSQEQRWDHEFWTRRGLGKHKMEGNEK